MQNATTTHPLKIHADTSNMKLTGETKDYFEKFVLPNAIEILSTRLSVTTQGYIPPLGSVVQWCEDKDYNTGETIIAIPSDVESQTFEDTDLIIFFGSVSGSSSTIAYAAPCLFGKFNFLLHLRSFPFYNMGKIFHIYFCVKLNYFKKYLKF
jgi:hypothetical protein